MKRVKRILLGSMFTFLLTGLVVLMSPNSAAAQRTSNYSKVSDLRGDKTSFFEVEFKINWSNSNKTACSSVSINVWNVNAPKTIRRGRVKVYFKDGKEYQYDINMLEKGRNYQKTYQGTCTDVVKAEFSNIEVAP